MAASQYSDLSAAMLHRNTLQMIQRIKATTATMRAMGMLPPPRAWTKMERLKWRIRSYIRDRREKLGEWIAGRSFEDY